MQVHGLLNSSVCIAICCRKGISVLAGKLLEHPRGYANGNFALLGPYTQEPHKNSRGKNVSETSLERIDPEGVDHYGPLTHQL
jgi:hypothetical protein